MHAQGLGWILTSFWLLEVGLVLLRMGPISGGSRGTGRHTRVEVSTNKARTLFTGS